MTHDVPIVNVTKPQLKRQTLLPHYVRVCSDNDGGYEARSKISGDRKWRVLGQFDQEGLNKTEEENQDSGCMRRFIT
jgi:hypothetical protein